MLVKMASSKLVIKSVDRTDLFFNKFQYRVNINDVPNSYWVHQCSTILEYIERIDDLYAEWDQSKQRYPNGWFRKPLSSAEIDLDRIENIITLIQKYNDKSIVKYRNENSTLGIYTSNLDIAKEFANTLKIGTLTQVNVMPTGIMLFKREIPAKYRAYMSNSRMPSDFKQELLDYLKRTPDINPSNAFYTWLHRGSYHNYNPMLWNKYYVDYNDEKNLMMMMLMFPGMIGKKYKLEKK